MAEQITLTADQVQTLRDAERMLHDLLPAIDGLEQCGENCQQLRAQNNEIRAKIQAIQTQFSPPHLQPQQQR